MSKNFINRYKAMVNTIKQILETKERVDEELILRKNLITNKIKSSK